MMSNSEASDTKSFTLGTTGALCIRRTIQLFIFLPHLANTRYRCILLNSVSCSKLKLLWETDWSSIVVRCVKRRFWPLCRTASSFVTIISENEGTFVLDSHLIDNSSR
jgi:hypothetical protein